MPEDQPVLTRRRPPVGAVGDLAVGAAYADRESVDQKFTRAGFGVGKLVQAQ